MPAPLPKELRDRFARLLREGLSRQEASHRLQVSAATGGRWAGQIRRTGVATVASMGRPSGTGKLAAHDRAVGHQGGNASRDIRDANALPVTDGPAFAA